MDDEVDEDEGLVDAVEDVVATLGNLTDGGSEEGEAGRSSRQGGLGGWDSGRSSATGSSDGEGDDLPLVAEPDSSSDEGEGAP